MHALKKDSESHGNESDPKELNRICTAAAAGGRRRRRLLEPDRSVVSERYRKSRGPLQPYAAPWTALGFSLASLQGRAREGKRGRAPIEISSNRFLIEFYVQ